MAHLWRMYPLLVFRDSPDSGILNPETRVHVNGMSLAADERRMRADGLAEDSAGRGAGLGRRRAVGAAAGGSGSPVGSGRPRGLPAKEETGGG